MYLSLTYGFGCHGSVGNGYNKINEKGLNSYQLLMFGFGFNEHVAGFGFMNIFLVLVSMDMEFFNQTMLYNFSLLLKLDIFSE